MQVMHCTQLLKATQQILYNTFSKKEDTTSISDATTALGKTTITQQRRTPSGANKSEKQRLRPKFANKLQLRVLNLFHRQISCAKIQLQEKKAFSSVA